MTNIVLFSSLLLAVVCIALIAGIIWRTESLLDQSYKYFLYASIIFLILVLFDIFKYNHILPEFPWRAYAKALFIIVFTLGVLKMRSLVRHLDGELVNRRKKKRS